MGYNESGAFGSGPLPRGPFRLFRAQTGARSATQPRRRTFKSPEGSLRGVGPMRSVLCRIWVQKTTDYGTPSLLNWGAELIGRKSSQSWLGFWDINGGATGNAGQVVSQTRIEKQPFVPRPTKRRQRGREGLHGVSVAHA